MTKRFLITLALCCLFPIADLALPAGYSPVSVAQAAAWYSGGNLHDANALQWQKASYENKLATCADFVANFWVNKNFKPGLQEAIKNVDDIKPFAKALVEALDTALEKDPDAKKNMQMYGNIKVAEAAAMLVHMMGWMK